MDIYINSRSSGAYSRVVLNNRPHLVTTVIAAECGSVMNGILYTEEFLRNTLSTLNRKPAPSSHPKVGGENVSADDPLAQNANGIGAFVDNSRIEGGNLVADLYVDIAKAETTDDGKELINRIQNGIKVAVSTGLTNAKLVAEKGVAKARNYTNKIVDGVFNHLAILLRETPAGENTYTVNSDLVICNADLSSANNGKTQEVVEMDKSELVTAIICNASNKFSVADKASLNAMSLDALVNALHSNAVEKDVTVETAQKVIESAGLTVNSADFDKEAYAAFIENKDAFDKFKKEKDADKKKKVDEIVSKSKMPEKDVQNMSDAGIDALFNSLVPTQNYGVNQQTVTNNDRTNSGAEIQLHEGA